jgi:hypothetical protein
MAFSVPSVRRSQKHRKERELMSFDLGDYVDVRHRLELALLKFPNLRVVENEPQLINMGERIYIQCAVTVYRDHDDAQPMRAYCWEVWPGRTPYTKDSEQMNGATSALGRALGYMGFGIKAGLASANEVRTAQGNSHPSTEPATEQKPPQRPQNTPTRPTGVAALTGMATLKQIDLITTMRRERGLEVWDDAGKTYAEASEEITRLKQIPRNG